MFKKGDKVIVFNYDKTTFKAEIFKVYGQRTVSVIQYKTRHIHHYRSENQVKLDTLEYIKQKKIR